MTKNTINIIVSTYLLNNKFYKEWGILVSVIIAVYNGEKYINEAIESVLNQTYRNIELIVVDDGSTDSTANIVKRYKDIKYIFQEHKGKYAARNLAMENAHGDYITFIDADDAYINTKIEKQLQVLNRNPEVDVVYNDLIVADENLGYIHTLKNDGKYENKEDLLANTIYRQVIQGPICMMIRRDAKDVKWDENLKYVGDYKYIIDLANNYEFKYLEESLYKYRNHKENIFNNYKEVIKEEIQLLKNIGINKINKSVDKSTYNNYEKNLLISKIYIKIDELEEAKAILEYIKDEKESSSVYFYLGICNYKLNKVDKAINNYKEAIRINKKMAEAYNNLGCCVALKKKKQADKYFQKAIKINKEYIDAKFNLEALVNEKNEFNITESELRLC